LSRGKVIEGSTKELETGGINGENGRTASGNTEIVDETLTKVRDTCSRLTEILRVDPEERRRSVPFS
jgi:hypothetical protein